MVFHIFVLDPVFRDNEVGFQSAYLLSRMEARFRKLVGGSIDILVTTGAVKAYLLSRARGDLRRLRNCVPRSCSRA